MPLLRNSRSFASCVAPRMFESVEYAFSDAHLVPETRPGQILGHLLAAAELVDELLIEPRLVDAQARIHEQAVPIEALDVVAFERAAVAPDIDVVFLHGGDEHGAGHGAPERRRVEVRDAGGRDVERARLKRRNAFGDKLRTAVDQPGRRGAVLQRLARNLVVVRLVRLAEIGRVRIRDGAFRAHPVERGARIEAAGKGDADFLARGKILQNVAHVSFRLSHKPADLMTLPAAAMLISQQRAARRRHFISGAPVVVADRLAASERG